MREPRRERRHSSRKSRVKLSRLDDPFPQSTVISRLNDRQRVRVMKLLAVAKRPARAEEYASCNFNFLISIN